MGHQTNCGYLQLFSKKWVVKQRASNCWDRFGNICYVMVLCSIPNSNYGIFRQTSRFKQMAAKRCVQFCYLGTFKLRWTWRICLNNTVVFFTGWRPRLKRLDQRTYAYQFSFILKMNNYDRAFFVVEAGARGCKNMIKPWVVEDK